MHDPQPITLLVLDDRDDVGVAPCPIAAGAAAAAGGRSFRARTDVPAGHKVALRDLAAGHPVRKYGEVIGHASAPILAGDWVHTHNLEARPFERQGAGSRPVAPESAAEQRTFDGYLRPDGRVGTRNYLAVLASTNCAADAARLLAERLRREALPGFAHVDGIVAITHGLGCGMAIGGRDLRVLRRCLAGVAEHPNVGGAIWLGLGCEVNAVEAAAREQRILRPAEVAGAGSRRPVVLSIQACGGVRPAVEAGFAAGLRMLREVDAARQTPRPLADLTVGTNCGGSDACSGITANPALGLAGDRLGARGARWVLAETPETYGAEHLLAERARTPDVASKLLSRMRWWERHTASHGTTMDANPAPGNKAGGITTIYEKALGAVTKGGSMPLAAVYDYAERVASPGLSFMDTPGHDPVSVTGLVAGGCNLIAFTTGRGSCLAFPPVPVLKIATNSVLFEAMPGDMDLDAGVALRGVPLGEVADAIFEALIAVASGRRTRGEEQGLGEHTFVPWALGPVL